MNHRLFSCTVAMLFTMVAPMAKTQTPTPGASGIEGVIMVSPSRPGPDRIDIPNVAPAGNVKFVVKKDDVLVTSFTTDAEGHFRISLPPGHYTVMREGVSTRIGRWRFEAEAKAGEVTTVRWTADSGMR